MGYDYQKYKDKRERVLGIQKRGFTFGTIAGIVSLVIVVALGGIMTPKAIAYLSTRNYDDAIFKVASAKDGTVDLVKIVQKLDGVKDVSVDHDGTRLVVTYHRHHTNEKQVIAALAQYDLTADLLNKVSHQQRQATLKEEAKFEAL